MRLLEVVDAFDQQRHGGLMVALHQIDVPGLEIFLSGIREEGDIDVSREYVAVETRLSPVGRWSFYQRAEIDVNNGWRREQAGASSQLSNLALTLDYRLSRSSRFTISYDRWERYLTEDSRDLREDELDRFLRQGFRARFSYGRPRGLGFSLYAGYRARDGEGEDTVSLGTALRWSDLAGWRLNLGGDVLAYTNPATEGFVARLQTSKHFLRGHQIGLLLGGRIYNDKIFDDVGGRSSQWIRLFAWLELPLDLYSRAEIEYTTGDDARGQRLILSLGYRL